MWDVIQKLFSEVGTHNLHVEVLGLIPYTVWFPVYHRSQATSTELAVAL